MGDEPIRYLGFMFSLEQRVVPDWIVARPHEVKAARIGISPGTSLPACLLSWDLEGPFVQVSHIPRIDGVRASRPQRPKR